MVARPQYAPLPGPIMNGTIVRISCATPGAELQYSINGSTNWLVYTQALTINGGTTLLAYATKQGYQPSFQSSGSFPVVSNTPPDGGAYNVGWIGLAIGKTGELFCPVGSRVYKVSVTGDAAVFAGDNDG